MAFDLWKTLKSFFRGASSGVTGSWEGSRRTNSAVYVSEDLAFRTTAFLRAARVVAEGMGSMPLKLYEEGEDELGRKTRTTVYKHKSFKALCYEPCWLTKSEFIETITLHAFVRGNGYALINRGPDAKESDPILELLPLLPGDVSVSLDDQMEPIYRVTMPGLQATYRKSEILHIRGPSWDGVIGMDTLRLAEEAIGLAYSLEKAQAVLMSSDARPAGVLSTGQGVSDDAANRIRERWRQAYGPNGTKGVAVLDNGFKFETIQMSAVDAQHIENRRMQIEEIARATGVFPHMLMHTATTMTFASSSEFFAAHVKYTMLPWVNRWEEALKRDAIGWSTKNYEIWARFTMDVLLRANPTERQAFYAGMFNIGALSSNDIRALENLNPRPGGDEYLTPLNMGKPDGGDPKDPAKDPPKDPPPPPDPNAPPPPNPDEPPKDPPQ